MADSISISFSLPNSWTELTDRQLTLVYSLLATDRSTVEIKTLCMMKWSGAKVIGRQYNGAYLLRKGKFLFEITPLTIAQLLPYLDFLGSLPTVPVRPVRLKHRPAIAADFSEVPFEKFIIVDNLYQGYLQIHDESLLDEMSTVLYPGIKIPLAPEQRVAVFYWTASLKDYFSRRYPDFFQPVSEVETNMLRAPSMNVEAAMNAQIRALTKGDITKEAEVLSLDTHRALTELDAQAREFRELNSRIRQ